MKSNQQLKDIAFILGLSIILALWFNFFGHSNGISLIREKQEVAIASDDEFLLIDTASTLTADTVKVAIDSVKLMKKTLQDSLKNVKRLQDSLKNATVESGPIKAKSILYKQILQLLKDPNVLVIDARNEHEFAEGHLPNAKHVFAMEFEQHIPELIALPKDKRIIVYCGGGECELSHDVCNGLIGLGFQKVYIYIGGWEDWKKNGSGKGA
jgi:rhodanese-related sulfurtransferase